MSKEDDYRKNAADTFELAQRASSTADKGRCLCSPKGGLISRIGHTGWRGVTCARLVNYTR
jgi:hypothetical protein